MKKLLLVVVSSLLLGACSLFPTKKTSGTPVGGTQSSATTVGGKMTVQLAAQNNSGEPGTATLEEVNGQVKVTLTLQGGVSAPQPAHIHTGACPNPGAVKYPLNDVIAGKSETTLGVNLASLQSEGALAINVHKSAKEMSSYASCGNLE